MKKLEAKNIYYTYNDKYQKNEVLKNVSCSFKEGNMYAIIGASGSGKTTLLSLLAGLGTPTRGEIKVDEKILVPKDTSFHRQNNVSVIYQSFHLFPTLSVIENVMYPLKVVNKSKRNVKELAIEKLQKVGIQQEYYNKLPMMLSGGEQQRVAIARALCSKGNFILADEPTGNLDTENTNHIIHIFRKLVDEGYCVILITHDLAITKQVDYIYQMVDGKLMDTKKRGS